MSSRGKSCIEYYCWRIVGRGSRGRGARYRIRLPCHDMNRRTNMVEGIKYARRINRGLAIKVSQ